MRKLILKDVVAVAKIMKKADLKAKVNDILKFFDLKNDDKDDDDKDKDTKKNDIIIIGVNSIIAIIEILGDSNTEQDLYDLLTDIFEEDAQYMELDKLITNLEMLCKENNILNFLQFASQLME